MTLKILNRNNAISYRSLRLQALETDQDAFCSTYEQESELSLDTFRKRLEPTESHFVAGGYIDDRLVCSVAFDRMNGGKAVHKGVITGMYCETASRGTGLAKQVFTFLLEEIRKLDDVDVIYLSVVSGNERSKNFYTAFGFKTYGTEPKSLFDGTHYFDQDLMYLML